MAISLECLDKTFTFLFLFCICLQKLIKWKREAPSIAFLQFQDERRRIFREREREGRQRNKIKINQVYSETEKKRNWKKERAREMFYVTWTEEDGRRFPMYARHSIFSCRSEFLASFYLLSLCCARSVFLILFDKSSASRDLAN